MSETPSHPGTVLLERWLKPNDLTQYRLAKQLHTETRRINEVVDGLRNISPELALRLSLFFENEPGYWLELQLRYDVAVARKKHLERLRREIRPLSKLEESQRST